MTAAASHHRAPSDARGSRAASRRAVPAHLSACAGRARGSRSFGSIGRERRPIPAVVEHAVLTERRTQLGTGDDAIHTVEHVLAAVAGAEVDDVTIELDGPEPPIMDGSAAPFLEALASAGLESAARPGGVSYAAVADPRGRRRVDLRGASRRIRSICPCRSSSRTR